MVVSYERGGWDFMDFYVDYEKKGTGASRNAWNNFDCQTWGLTNWTFSAQKDKRVTLWLLH